MNYRQLDQAISLLQQAYNSTHTYADELFIPTPERIRELQAKAQALLVAVGPVPDAGINGVLRNHFTESLEGLLGRLADDQGYPFRYINQVTEDLTPLVEMDPRPAADRAVSLTSRLAQMPDLFAATVAATGKTAADRRVMTAETMENTAGLLARLRTRTQAAWADTVRPAALAELDAAFIRAQTALQQAQQELTELPEPAEPVMGLSYRQLLAQVFGVDVDELVARTRQDVADLELQMERLAKEINPNKTAAQILKEDITPYESAERMLEAMREMVVLTRSLTASIIDLPEGDECRVELVPPHLEHLFPWGGYSGPDSLAGHRVGTCYINGSNYQSISRGWLMNMALHEAYPGHHTQWVCASQESIPLTARLTQLYSRGSHACEGMAHRSEKVFQDIYGDPTFPLFVLYRQMHTAVRILCELEINHFQNGVEAALALYDQYMGFPEHVAKGQTRLQRMWRGYMTSYFTGHRQFAQIQRETGLSDSEFTRILFTHGFVSVATLGRIARLSPKERAEVYADFRQEG